jgi:hypothetical protein
MLTIRRGQAMLAVVGHGLELIQFIFTQTFNAQTGEAEPKPRHDKHREQGNKQRSANRNEPSFRKKVGSQTRSYDGISPGYQRFLPFNLQLDPTLAGQRHPTKGASVARFKQRRNLTPKNGSKASLKACNSEGNQRTFASFC